MPEAALQHLGMDQFQRFLFLRTVPGLASVPPEVAKVIAANTREHLFPKGSYLYREGEASSYVNYIVRGECEIRRHGKPVRVMGPRMAVGGVAVLADDNHGYDCVALTDTITLQLSQDDAQEVFEDHFVFMRRVLEGTAREVLSARRQLGSKAGFGDPAEPFACPDRAFDLVEKMAFLRKTFSFADTEIDAIADLAQEVHEVRLPAGTLLWEVGDSSPYFLLPLCGIVECHAFDPEQRFRLGPGDSVGSLDAMAREPRWFRAVVAEDLVAFHVELETMLDVIEDHFGMAMSLLRAMATGMSRLYDLKAGVTH